MADSAPIVLSLCSGIGMLDEAARIVWPGARTAAYCEWEAYAAAVLLARMEDASLEPAPVWGGDLRDFNAQPFRGVVDMLVAGLPCQPYSCAGRQRGNDDARSWGEDGAGPLPQFLRIVGECRPAVVFLENVPAWVMGGWFRPVGEELCRLGYEIEEPVFLAAADVGASHERERVFILAHLPGERGRGWRLSATGGRQHATDVDGECAELADAQHQPGCSEWQPEPRQRRAKGPENGAMPWQAGCGQGHTHEQREQQPHHPDGSEPRGDTRPGDGGTSGGLDPLASGDGLAVACGTGPEGGERGGAHGQRHGAASPRPTPELREVPLFAPAPGDTAGWLRTLTDEQRHELAPAIEPGLRVLADGVALVVDASRADQLRCAGNGVVALQAAVALVELLSRAAATEEHRWAQMT